MALLDAAVLIGESPGMVALRATVTRLLERESPAHRLPPILLLGETGTGKSLLAREIHRHGPRNEHPFIGVSCAAIPEGLLEAELFGFEQGAFTDARQGKPGLFHAADRGTLFLDEIGALSTGLQAKLLTVIDEQLVRRLGTTRSEAVSVNVISATNDDLTRLVAERRFREDLYYRLSTLVLHLPPLRRRGDDILLLARHLLAKVCSKHGLSARTLTDDACSALLAHGWPGNVRELANVIERAVLLTTGPSIAARELALGSGRHAGEGVAPPSGEAPAVGPERDRLRALLREVGGNLTKAAERLGLPRNTLRYRLRKEGLRRTEPLGSSGDPGIWIKWDRRPLAFLRVRLVAPAEAGVAHGVARALSLGVETVRSFGGRIEELDRTGFVASFGLEPTENVSVRAALVAQEIQRTSSRVGMPLPLGVTAAIHVAEVSIGQAGDVTVIDRTDRADAWRILDAASSQAAFNEVLASRAAVPFLEERFLLEPIASAQEVAGSYLRVRGLGP